MADEQQWMDARRLARYVRQNGGWLHRGTAESALKIGAADFGRAFGLAYSRRWIDVCGRYLVVPPRRG